MKVYIPCGIISGIYQNGINFENTTISYLFGVIESVSDSLELVVLYSTETYNINNINNNVEISLPEGVNRLAAFIRLSKTAVLDDLIDKINVEYLIVNNSESHDLNLYEIKNKKLDSLESEFKITNNEYDLIKLFNYKFCNYTLFMETTIPNRDFNLGFHVPDKSFSDELMNKIQSFDLDTLVIGDSDSDITTCKVVDSIESNDVVFAFAIQVSILLKNNAEIDMLKSMIRDKINKFKTYLNDEIKGENYNILTLFISKFEEKEVDTQHIDTQHIEKIKPKNKNKGKSSKSSKPKKQVKIVENDTIGLANGVTYTPVSGTGIIELSIEFNPNTSQFMINCESKIDDGNDKNRIKISLLFKLDCIKSICGNHKSIPLTIPYYHLLNKLTIYNVGYTYNKYPYLIRPYNPESLLPESIVINPHAKMERPCWISPKNSSIATISGRFAYYHYCMDNIDDSGWGCCYRSLQMIWSWYLLQNYTVERVPTHWQIQTILNENDTVGKVGSSTWIGTVESSYIINWKLNMLCKIYYLSDFSYLTDYSAVIKEHFLLQKTPIIMGIGNYAYVLLGICLDSESEPTYLIADPHYSGGDNMKSIAQKGVGWKRPEFLNKASDSGFINLLLPQTSLYND